MPYIKNTLYFSVDSSKRAFPERRAPAILVTMSAAIVNLGGWHFVLHLSPVATCRRGLFRLGGISSPGLSEHITGFIQVQVSMYCLLPLPHNLVMTSLLKSLVLRAENEHEPPSGAKSLTGLSCKTRPFHRQLGQPSYPSRDPSQGLSLHCCLLSDSTVSFLGGFSLRDFAWIFLYLGYSTWLRVRGFKLEVYG